MNSLRAFPKCILITAALAPLMACHEQPSPSAVKDLTDFPNSNSSGSSRLIWQDPEDANQFVLARCPDALEVIRANCNADSKDSRAHILATMQASIAPEFTVLQQEMLTVISRVLQDHPRFKNALANLNAFAQKSADLQTESDTVQSSKQGLLVDLKKIEQNIADKQDQIAKLEGFIAANPNNQALKRQLETRQSELGQVLLDKKDVDTRISNADLRIDQISQTLAERATTLADMQDKIYRLIDETQVFHPDIEAVKGKVAALHTVENSFEQLLNVVAEFPEYSYRAQDLDGPLLPAADYLFKKSNLWTLQSSYEFADAANLLDLASPWTLKNVDGVSFLSSNPAAVYENNVNASLRLKELPVAPGQQVAITIKHRYETESGYDYGVIQYKGADGVWRSLTPAFGGSVRDWKEDRFTMSDLSGLSSLSLRLFFHSDSSTTARGWDIDSLKIVIQ